jgi:ribosomal protein S27E
MRESLLYKRCEDCGKRHIVNKVSCDGCGRIMGLNGIQGSSPEGESW